ncbi:PREDICTED: antigen KI-67 [Propithecus coquereli]|uniref:antigen KI-67 n=1 Tax=Propithecus coquereli TaxID=379532 RepID=UPI00063EED87|nr:PREDICTED: antigen KI-67 [Propithecus coquereli]
MGPSRRLVTIKRSGGDGPHFPLSLSTCLFGRGIECDIRIQLPVVSKQHCKIETNEQEAILYNFSSTNPTQVNGSAIDKPVQLKHGDIITIIDRSFRYENENCQNGNKSTRFPGKIPEQGPSRRVSRSSFSSDPDKSEGGPLKRRRVSFGGRLRPELFDENLPPNTPLKRGETPTKRKSLVAHTPTVLKKIIKEQPQPSNKESASEIHVEMMAQNVFVSSPVPSPRTTPVAGAQSRRSCRASSTSSGSKSQVDIPKRGGRKSGNLPSKRISISRSQHDILQMICSKRRSGASEANLIVAKSWADVVKLGVKQTQTKVVKHGPQRPKNKKQRRPNTPKKPVDDAHNQFSTGHANSPCTIIIGKAHTEKVNVPAQPYRMLNNFVSNQKMDFKENLSGLSEMFKTPVKEKSQLMSSGPVTLSSSENLLGKNFQVTNSAEEPLLRTSESFGENVLLSTWNAAKEPDTHSATPALQRQCVKENETLVKTPKNIYTATPVEMKTSDTETEPSKTVSSANTLRRSMELRNPQKLPIDSKNEDTKTDTVEDIMGKCLRRPPLREKKIEGEMKETERPFETYKEIIESKENSEMMADGRASRRTWGHKSEPASNPAGLKRWPEMAPMKDMTDTQDLQTPGLTREPRNEKDKTTKLYQRSLQAEPVNTPTNMNRQLRTSLGKVDVKEELSAVGRLTRTPEQTVHTHKEPVPQGKGTKMFQETPRQKADSENSVTGVKRWPRAAKEEVQPPEALSGFKELFQTPKRNDKPTIEDKTTKICSKSLQSEPVNTPTRTKRQPRTPLGKIATEEDLAALRKLSQTPGEATHTPKVLGEEKGIKAFKQSAEQKLDPAASVTGSRKRPRAAKEEAQPLEDLSGFKELFQTPKYHDKPTGKDKTTKIPCTSPQPEPVNTPTNVKRQPKTPLGKMNVEEELSAPRKLSQTAGEPTHTPKVRGEDKGIRAFKESAKQKPGLAASVTGSRRRPRAAEEKAQPLEDLAGFQKPFQTPGHTEESMTDGKSTKVPCTTLQPEPVDTTVSTREQPKTSLRKVSALRKLTETSGESIHMHKVLVGEDKGIKAFKQSAEQELDPAASVTGSRRRPGAAKEKAQPLEDLAGFKKPFQTPGHTEASMTVAKSTKMSCTSPQPEPVDTVVSTTRWPKRSLRNVSALRKLTQISGESTRTHEVLVVEDKGIRAFKQSAEQKLDLTARVTGSRRRPRASKEEAQPLENLAGFKKPFQTPGHTEKSMTNVKTTRSPLPELVNTTASTKRQPKGSLRKVSALQNLTQTSGETTHTSTEPQGGDKHIRVAKQSAKQKLDPAENINGCKRQPRAAKKEAKALEVLADFKELVPAPGQRGEPRNDTESLKTAPKQPPDSGEPLKTFRRVLRAPKVQPIQDMVGTRDPVKSQSKSNTALTSKRKSGKDDSVSGGKRLHCMTATEGVVEEEPANKKQRSAPREKCTPPEPLVVLKRSLRISAESMEPVEDLNSNNMKTKKREHKVEGSVTSNKGISLRPRRQNKSDVEQQKTEVPIAAEKIKIKRYEKKSVKTSQELEIENPGDRAKGPTERGKVGESRACSRSLRQSKSSQPSMAREEGAKEGVGTHTQNQTEKGVRGNSDFMSLRSRKVKIQPAVNKLGSEPEQRATRAIKRCAENPKDGKDIVSIKKIRTRSHRDSEDI